jgi:hypothetical protein
MASKSTTLTVRILTDATQATKGAEQAASGFDKFSSRIDSLVVPAAAVTGALALVGTAAVNSASRTEQAMGALDSVFGKNADVVEGWASSAADSLGLAKSEYAELASTIGAQLNNMGLSTQDALAGTKSLITLGGDLAATFGGSTAEAIEALSSALRGEADPAERYGLSLNQTAVNAKLAEQGLSGLTGEALKTAQTQAILALATEQAGGAVGQSAREYDTASAAQQRMTANLENASSELGTALLPAVTAVTSKLAEFAKWAAENSSLVITLAAVIGGLAAAILATAAALKVYAVIQGVMANATKIAAAGQWLLNAAMSANPIGLLIAAVVVIIGLIIYLWTTNEGFRDAVIAIWEAISAFAVAAWEAIVAAVGAAWEWILSAVEAAGAFIAGVWNAIVAAAQAAWDFVVSIVEAVVNFLIAYAMAVLSIYVAIWNAIATAAQAVWNWILSIVNAVIQGIIAYIRAAQTVITAVWNAIKAAAAAVWNGIASVIGGVINSIRSAVSSAGAFINGIWQGILDAGRSVWQTLESIVSGVMAAIMVPINAVKSAFDAIVDAVQNVISWISQIKIPDVLGGLGDIMGFSATPSVMVAATSTQATARGFASPSLGASTGGVLSAGGGGGLTIIVQGGLDSSDAIARRIRNILDGRERRTAGVVMGRRTR